MDQTIDETIPAALINRIRSGKIAKEEVPEAIMLLKKRNAVVALVEQLDGIIEIRKELDRRIADVEKQLTAACGHPLVTHPCWNYFQCQVCGITRRAESPCFKGAMFVDHDLFGRLVS